MTRRIVQLLLPLLAVAISLLTLSQANVTAQEVVVPQEARKSEQSGPEIVRSPSGLVSVKFERGLKISVGNRSTGPIVVVGWDRDYIEASAVSDLGAEAVQVWTGSDQSGARILLKADYAEIEEYPAGRGPSQRLRERRRAFGLRDPETHPSVRADVPISPATPVQPPSINQWPDLSRPREIFLEVKVPRYAEIEMITVNRSEVLVSGVETAITVSGARSAIKLRRVGAAEVKTSSGDVEVEDANGLVDVITTSGAIVVKNARSDVRALSLFGRIEIQCARGRVDVSNTDGPITLSGVIGDASATATTSDVRFSGAIRAEGRYYLKSMSGAVEMEAPANSPGFTASLSSYRGGIETDFSLKTNKAKTSNSSVNRRLIGRHGNGQAQITLDSFDGKVRLSKMDAGALKDCR
jgi:Putative adhesin